MQSSSLNIENSCINTFVSEALSVCLVGSLQTVLVTGTKFIDAVHLKRQLGTSVDSQTLLAGRLMNR